MGKLTEERVEEMTDAELADAHAEWFLCEHTLDLIEMEQNIRGTAAEFNVGYQDAINGRSRNPPEDGCGTYGDGYYAGSAGS